MAEGMRIDLLDRSLTDDFHFFECMGDTLFRVLRDKCQVEVVWVESAPVIFLRNVRRRDLGVVTQVVKREMKKWQYDEKSKVARL
jgi:hypothetical protein